MPPAWTPQGFQFDLCKLAWFWRVRNDWSPKVARNCWSLRDVFVFQVLGLTLVGEEEFPEGAAFEFCGG